MNQANKRILAILKASKAQKKGSKNKKGDSQKEIVKIGMEKITCRKL